MASTSGDADGKTCTKCPKELGGGGITFVLIFVQDSSVSSSCRGKHGRRGPLPTALEGLVVGRGTKRKSEEDVAVTQFFKNYNEDRVRSAQMEFDIRCEELALAREQTQRQLDASLQQNQMMTTMQFMMVSFLFSLLSHNLFTVLIVLSTAPGF